VENSYSQAQSVAAHSAASLHLSSTSDTSRDIVGFSKSSGWRAARLRNFKIVQGLAYVKWNAAAVLGGAR